jgi:hypothetical protein
MRGKYGWSHAFIGVKGDSTQTRESSSGIAPARVVLGVPTRTGRVWAAFEGFRVVAGE